MLKGTRDTFAVFCGMTSVAVKMTMGESGDVSDPAALRTGEQFSLLPAVIALIPVAAGIYLMLQF